MTILNSRHIRLSVFWQGWIALWLFYLLTFQVNAQHSPLTVFPETNCPRPEREADIWYFGEKAGIEFLNGTATPLTDENVMTSYKSSGVISDSLGNLLFFTDGKNVWDRTFSTMPYSPSLEGDLGVSQPCIVVPQPGGSNKYYIFTVDVMAFKPDNTYETKGLEYSIVDMNANEGKGNGTLDWNMPLLSPVCQKVTAVYNRNQKDIWIIAHKWDSDEFYAWLLTAQGLGDAVVSKLGSVQGGGYPDQNVAWGYMKASPDGARIALAVSGKNLVELFDFNNSTGVISNARSYTFNVAGIAPYGIEFSQDGLKLYTSLLQIAGNGPPAYPSRIYQFDLGTGWNPPIAIDSIAGIRLGGMQLATDGKIYVSRTVNLTTRMDSLDVIYNPTRPGTECNYNRLANVPNSRFSLNGRKSIYGLPNLMQSYLCKPIFTHDSICHGDITMFNITNKSNIDNVLWEFGDGQTDTQMSTIHTYAQPGTYKVRLTETYNGISYPDSASVTIFANPVVNLGDTILAFAGSSIKLHAGGGFMEYQWSNGCTDSIATVESLGKYFVTVKDFHCCTSTDSVFVNVFQFYMPNAFAPEGVNSIFKPVTQYQKVNFVMNIYDRWGQLVFTSNDINVGWDGTMGGQKCPPGAYAYVVNIDFVGSDIVVDDKVVLKGAVTLVR